MYIYPLEKTWAIVEDGRHDFMLKTPEDLLLRHTKPITRLLRAYKNQTTEM